MERTPTTWLDRHCDVAEPAIQTPCTVDSGRIASAAMPSEFERKLDSAGRRPMDAAEDLPAANRERRRHRGRPRLTRCDLERRLAELETVDRGYRALAEAGALIFWRADASGAILENRGWKALTGQDETACRVQGWLEAVHPADRPSLTVAWTAAMKSDRLALKYRVRTAAGPFRWVRSRGVPVFGESDVSRLPVEWVGTTEDIDAQCCAEQRREILAREADHRAKNTLAVVQAVLRLTRSDSPKVYAQKVEGRVAAMARAHSLLAASRWSGADLRALLEDELAAYRGGVGRVVLNGPQTALAPAAAQALSMAIHELATNAAKYGALSIPAGRLIVSWQTDKTESVLRLQWVEAAGPPILIEPRRRGFGSRVVEAVARDQLGGKVEHRWEPTGLVCAIEVPLARSLADSNSEPAAGP